MHPEAVVGCIVDAPFEHSPESLPPQLVLPLGESLGEELRFFVALHAVVLTGEHDGTGAFKF